MIVPNYTPEDLKKLPLRAIVALSARCARRVEHLALLPDDDPQTERCRAAVAGAIRLAKELGPGHTVVTILADSGARYQSRLFNPAFLKEKNLPTPPWLDQ